MTEVVCEEDIYNVPESDDGAVNRLRESENKTPTKEVFVSKYFGGGNTSSPVARIFKRSAVSPDGSVPSPKKMRLTIDANQVWPITHFFQIASSRSSQQLSCLDIGL